MAVTIHTTAIPKLGVGAVIRNHKDEILLVKRNRNPEQGTWSIPGGKLDMYESLEECVIREVKEEVNLDITVTQLLCTAETIRPEHDEHWVSLIYDTTVQGGEARNNEADGAIGDMRWFSLDKLPEQLACFTKPAIYRLLEKA
ncbi:NUDIX domain-containing protein [Paenibacillus popilliae]|uniref:NUDIX domain-containing protein n=1 Tax=Paenibacillus popilliae TaxID=78057 RepID=A0ABY3AHV6_PAEPP|nr:NUDIX domain-containing protein [Paenibacillus sp. SDF0028]TQR41414.1 NUDIX domain-containing protein [Paenibacillus sp. SDF0028]